MAKDTERLPASWISEQCQERLSRVRNVEYPPRFPKLFLILLLEMVDIRYM